jgi:glycerol-3-phosphate dehydrogenase
MPDLMAEVVYAVRHEQARTLVDVLLRRTRLGLLAARELCTAGGTAPLRVAQVMGAEFGWDGVRVAAEVRAFEAEAASEGIAVAA